MTAPSFALSFSSFPDFDSESKDDDRKERDDKKRHKKRKHKQEHHRRETSPEREDVPTNELLLDRLFYSDKGGDFLNIQFGGLHVGDVPKYNLVGSMVQLLLYGNS